MDPAVAMTVLKVLGGLAGALALLWAFVLWDGRQARAQFRSEEFEARVAALFAVAIKGEDFEAVISKIVSRAFADQLGRVLDQVAEFRREMKDLHHAQAELEKKVEAMLARGRFQRRTDGEESGA